MYARIYDKAEKIHYKSLIYCEIVQAYDRQYVVINPHTRSFELVDYLDKGGDEIKPLVEIIQDSHEEWVSYENAFLLKYKAYCKQNHKEMTIKSLWGYPDVCENYMFLSSILEKGSVPLNEAGICIRDLTDTNEWNYINTQEDANEVMKVFAGFHDATLDKLCYEEQHGSTKVTATFVNNGWYGVAELCFEGILAVNIRPAKENCSREIFEATILVRDKTVLWADWHMEQEDLSFDGSYIKALSLKWRKMG